MTENSIERQLTIRLDSSTLSKLQSSQFNLYLLKAVSSSDKAAVPLVWARIDYQTTTKVSLPEQVSAYFSDSSISPNKQIAIGSSQSICPGQTATASDAGTISIAGGAPAGVFELAGAQSKSFVGGLAAQAQSSAEVTPYCAVPVYAQSLVGMTSPVQVLAMFATPVYEPGAFMQTALGPAILIDFAASSTRQVRYDIESGWSANGATWAQIVAAGSDLDQILILDPGPDNPFIVDPHHP